MLCTCCLLAQHSVHNTDDQILLNEPRCMHSLQLPNLKLNSARLSYNTMMILSLNCSCLQKDCINDGDSFGDR